MSEEEARKLLAEARKASNNIDLARARRDKVIQACMDAGIPRQQIMDATGLSRARLYEILNRLQ